MRIAIDLSQIIYGTGVSQYTDYLVQNLLKIDKENEYLLFGGSFRRYTELKERIRGLVYGYKAEKKVFLLPPRVGDLIWNRLHTLPIENLVGKIDVFHSSDWTQPPSKAFKVTTVHDLMPLRFPKLIHRDIVEAHKRRLKWVIKEVDRIIVPSEATKEDLVAYGAKEEKIRVISESTTFERSNAESVEKVKTKYKITNDYLLAFATAPYKNIESIIRAYELSSSGRNLKLILVGRQSLPLIEENRNIRLTGYVETAELSALLTGAKALIFASLYEGFGQPILEAFKCQTPVVTSNTSSMPEVAGGAAVLVDPYKVGSIVEGIDTALANRKTLIKKRPGPS